jgi:hypothetical protein
MIKNSKKYILSLIAAGSLFFFVSPKGRNKKENALGISTEETFKGISPKGLKSRNFSSKKRVRRYKIGARKRLAGRKSRKISKRVRSRIKKAGIRKSGRRLSLNKISKYGKRYSTYARSKSKRYGSPKRFSKIKTIKTAIPKRQKTGILEI